MSISSSLPIVTRAVHRITESHGLIRDILKCKLPLDVYIKLQMSLLEIYKIMEDAIYNCRNHDIVTLVYFPELFRAQSIENDLKYLNQIYSPEPLALALDDSVQKLLRELESRIKYASKEDPCLLVAYSYVRYLGDVSGGQYILPKVKNAYNLESEGATFYDFNSIDDLGYFKTLYRARLDQIPQSEQTKIEQEAIYVFEFHIRLFDALYKYKKDCNYKKFQIIQLVKLVKLKTMVKFVIIILIIIVGIIYSRKRLNL